MRSSLHFSLLLFVISLCPVKVERQNKKYEDEFSSDVLPTDFESHSIPRQVGCTVYVSWSVDRPCGLAVQRTVSATVVYFYMLTS